MRQVQQENNTRQHCAHLQDLAHEGEAVGVHAAGGQAQDDVALLRTSQTGRVKGRAAVGRLTAPQGS